MPDVSNITASVNASDLQWYDCRIESAGLEKTRRSG